MPCTYCRVYLSFSVTAFISGNAICSEYRKDLRYFFIIFEFSPVNIFLDECRLSTEIVLIPICFLLIKAAIKYFLRKHYERQIYRCCSAWLLTHSSSAFSQAWGFYSEEAEGAGSYRLCLSCIWTRVCRLLTCSPRRSPDLCPHTPTQKPRWQKGQPESRLELRFQHSGKRLQEVVLVFIAPPWSFLFPLYFKRCS